MDDIHWQPAALQQRILAILRRSSLPLREYDLIEALAEDGDFGRDAFDDELSMFQCHFILFHCLYRLRDELRSSGEADLDIHCLAIGLRPYLAGGGRLPERHDALREYYLDWSNLQRTDAQEVAALLNRFWRRFVAGDRRQQALNVLGLCDPVSFAEIKSQYRRLVMQHHPDRGGDTAQLQLINEAMTQLEACYPSKFPLSQGEG